VALAACGAASAPEVALDLSDPRRPAVVVRGLSRADLRALDGAGLSRDAWTAILKVSVAAAGKAAADPVAGSYAVAGGAVRFTPVLPFEPGREYVVVFDPAAAPASPLRNVRAVSSTVSTPAPPRAASVRVAEVYPGGSTVPENLLRMYVEFSGPMGTRNGQDYIRILDGAGKDIEGALLPLDTDLWNGDRTRFTILFDPGRVKRGILPNRGMGRPLEQGSTMTIVVSRGWPDANGQPLAAEFRKDYRVGPANEKALSTATWRVAPPVAASREPLTVSFPAPLDRALLQRAFSVVRADETIAGEARVENGETAWSFVPRDAWRSGIYVLSVLPALEDPSGNQIGQAFETLDAADDSRRSAAQIPFRIR
jgi:hypothetical protein